MNYNSFNRPKLFFCLLLAFTIGNVCQADEGLVGYWKMDETSGDIIHDLSIYENHASAYGAEHVDGCNGYARHFNSNEDSVIIPHILAYEFPADFSITAKILLDSIPTYEGKIISKCLSFDSTNGYTFSVGANGIVSFGIADNSGDNILNTTTTLNIGQCYCLTAVRSGTNMLIYIDGLLDTLKSGASDKLLDSQASLKVGIRKVENTHDQSFPGLIDDLRIYNRALNENEVNVACFDISNTLYIPPTQTCLVDSGIVVPVKYKCDTPTGGMTLPIKWDEPKLELDSVSFVGTAVEGWDNKSATIFPDTQIVLLGMFPIQFGEPIESGVDTTIAYLYFSVPITDEFGVCIYDCAMAEDTLLVTFDTALSGVEGQVLLFADTSQPAVGFTPEYEFDTLTIAAYRPGEINPIFDCQRNLLDILSLIDSLYGDGPSSCPVEASDVNGDCNVNLLDILYFISFIYDNPKGPAPVCGCLSEPALYKPSTLFTDEPSYTSSGLITSSITGNKTQISVDLMADIKGLELILKCGETPQIKNRLNNIQMYADQDNDIISVAWFDLQGNRCISEGYHTLLEIDEEVEIVSAFAGDVNAQAIYLDVLSKNDEDVIIPQIFALRQNHPNPFNPVTQISFELQVTSHVMLDVYNITGQKVSTIINEQVEPGYHTVEWDGSSFASGVYFYRIQAGDIIESRKMMLLK